MTEIDLLPDDIEELAEEGYEAAMEDGDEAGFLSSFTAEIAEGVAHHLEGKRDKESSRCIMVLTPLMHGASAIAGLLHKVGVNMGGGFLQPGDVWRPKGYFEDKRWQHLNKQMVGQHAYDSDYPHESELDFWFQEQYEKLIRDREEAFPIWGVKDPRLSFMFDYVVPTFKKVGVDVFMVAPERDLDEAAQELREHSTIAYRGKREMTIRTASTMMERWVNARAKQIERFDGPVFHIACGELEEKAPELVAFCYEGLEKVTVGDKNFVAALEWLREPDNPDAGRS